MLIMSITSYGQTIRFKVDSLKIYSLPWGMKTMLSLNDEDVRYMVNEPKTFSKIKTIDTLALIEDFISIIENAKIDTLKYSIDSRMVIDFYTGNSILTTFVISANGYFNFNQCNYMRNSKVIKWINANVVKFE